MSGELLAFQDAFVAALGGNRAALSPWLQPGAGEAGLGVYRNTIAKGCIDALAANFPTVLGMVGEEWFRAAAALFAREAPPTHAALLDYGEAFPAWLDSFPPAQDTPYLAGIAQLDRLWTESLFAADATALGPEAFQALAPEALGDARVTLHPSVRFQAFDASLPDLWIAAREARADLELAPTPGGLFLSRPRSAVIHRSTGLGEIAFLSACRDRRTLAQAVQHAVSADPDINPANLFARLIADRAFSDLIPGAHP